MIRPLLFLLLLAAPAADAACRLVGGDSGPEFVLLTHAYSDAKAEAVDVDEAVRAIAASPIGAEGIRVHTSPLAIEACTRETKDSLVPYLRCSQAVNAALATCGVGASKILVLSKLAFTSRSSVAKPRETAGVFVSTATPGAWTPELLHELAHAFGLRDERPILTSRKASPGATPGPNCAATKEDAGRRWGDLIAAGRAGMFEGCAGNKRWLRPHDRTIMDSPRTMPEWGAANDRYLRDAVRCCFTSKRGGCDAAAKRNPELATCLP